MLTERQKLLIEKNISGNLTPEESQELKEYQNDPEFQEEFSFHEDLRQAVRLEQRDTLDDLLQGLRAEVEGELLVEESSEQVDKDSRSEIGGTDPKVRSLRPTWILAVAASLVLAVSLVFFLLMDSSPGVTIEHLALVELPENIQQPNDGPLTKDGININKNLALKAYKQNSYSEAESLFDEIPKQDKDNQVLLYNAITLLLLNQQDANDEYLLQGIEYLEAVSQGKSGYRLSAEWYLALAYLANGNDQDAEKLLIRIANAKHPYSEQAKEMLKGVE